MSFLVKFLSCFTAVTIAVGAFPGLSDPARENLSAYPFRKHLDEAYRSELLQAKMPFSPGRNVKKNDISDPSGTNGVTDGKSYIIKLDPDISDEDLAKLLRSCEYKQLGPSAVMTFRITCSDSDRFRKDAGKMLISMEADSIVTAIDMDFFAASGPVAAAFPYDDEYLGQQWAVDNMDLTEAWEITRGSDDVVVAVIDTGLKSELDDFSETLILNGWDFIEDNIVTGDPEGHGTMVTSVIAATPGNSIGTAGICENVTVIPLRILNEEGSGTSSDLISAIYFAADLGVDVINMSLGADQYISAEESAVEYALAKGCIVVAAAGNSGRSGYEYPASYEGVISAASHTEEDEHSSFSTYNDQVDVSAPGEYIIVLRQDGNYYYADGTSFSSPQVSGIAALARAVDPDVTSDVFFEAITLTSRDLGTTGKDVYYGYGAIDADDLLNYVIDVSGQEPPGPGPVKVISPERFDITGLSYNYPKYFTVFDYTAPVSGLYTFSSVSDDDFDIEITAEGGSGGPWYDTDNSPFWLTAELAQDENYHIEISNYMYPDYDYYSMSYVMSMPDAVTGAGVIVSSGGKTDNWSQSLIYDPVSAGKKALLVKPHDEDNQYMVTIYDSLYETAAKWSEIFSGSYYFTYEGPSDLNHVNIDMQCNDKNGAFDVIFEEMSVLEPDVPVTEDLETGDTLTGAEFVAPSGGNYRFETDAEGAQIEYFNNTTGTSGVCPSNVCEIELEAGMEVDFYIHTDGIALTQNFKIRKIYDLALLEGAGGDADGFWKHQTYPVASLYADADYSDINFSISEGASFELYSDKVCTIPFSLTDPVLEPGLHIAYMKVTAENGVDFRIYTLLIFIRDTGSDPPPVLILVDDTGSVLQPGVSTKSNVCVIPLGAEPIQTEITSGGVPIIQDPKDGFTTEGIYLIEATDNNGGKAFAGFSIDRTAPVISGVSAGKIYYKPTAAVFTEGTATINGNQYLSGALVSAEGNYALSVTDPAGNNTSFSFGIAKRTISFNSSGGSAVPSVKAFDDTKLSRPADPVREDYLFTGWYKDQGLTDDWDFAADRVSSSITLFAAWKTAVPKVLTSAVFAVNGSDMIVSKVSAGTKVSVFAAGFAESVYLTVKRGSRILSAVDYIATGDSAIIMDGDKAVATYKIVVSGDINGDGKVSLTDFVQQKSHLLKKTLLQGLNALAADVNGDDQISLTDFVKIKAHLLGKESIKPQAF